MLFEGHLTSEIIKKFLAEKPQDTIGLSIPGMPSGVPGMRGPEGRTNYGVCRKEGRHDIHLREPVKVKLWP